MYKVFIDGQEGTTGLQLKERLLARADISLLAIPSALRKDKEVRAEYINASDITFLCLPDTAAREVAAMADIDTKIIDASTAHRTDKLWAYGFPELGKNFADKIAKSNRISVPGCHASGFLALVYPLIELGVLPRDYPIVCHSITGYSGGGKGMIAEYQSASRDVSLDCPRQYGLEQQHKHLKEMQEISGLAFAPIFNPIVSNFAKGMKVTVPLYGHLLNNIKGIDGLFDALNGHYAGQQMVSVERVCQGFISANLMRGSNKMKIFVSGNDQRINLMAVFDNLGKGASGAAVQCMNIRLGLDSTMGLV